MCKQRWEGNHVSPSKKSNHKKDGIANFSEIKRNWTYSKWPFAYNRSFNKTASLIAFF